MSQAVEEMGCKKFKLEPLVDYFIVALVDP